MVCVMVLDNGDVIGYDDILQILEVAIMELLNPIQSIGMFRGLLVIVMK